MEYETSSQVADTNECDCVTVLKQRITAILRLTFGIRKANKMAVKKKGLGGRSLWIFINSFPSSKPY